MNNFFLYALLLLFIYFVLAGHRFSIFFTMFSFFILPVAAIKIYQLVSNLRTNKNIISKFKRNILVAFSIIIVFFAIYISYFFTREFDGGLDIAEYMLHQRVLIQPSETAHLSLNKILFEGDWDFYSAWRYIISDPISSSSNTTIQYLMINSFGESYTRELIDGGVQLAGGFPEGIFELFGPMLSLIFIALFIAFLSIAHRYTIICFIKGYYISLFFAIFLVYGFSLFFISGMINFIYTWTFILKILLFSLFYNIESGYILRKT